MNRWRDQHDSHDGEPVDLSAVGHDDAFITDLGIGRPTPVSDDSEYQLAAMITSWRMDALSAPIPAEPTLAQVDAAVAVQRGRGSMSRRLRIVSGAAAILAVFGAGLMVMSEGAEPGDPLWSVKQVVFSEQAKQTQARVNVEDNLDAAKAAYEAGDEQMARTYIARAEAELGPIGDADMIAKLRNRIADLRHDEDPGSDDKARATVLEAPSSDSTAPTTTDDESPSTTPSDKPTEPSTEPTSPSTPSTSPSKPTTTSPSETKSTTSPRPTGTASMTLQIEPTG